MRVAYHEEASKSFDPVLVGPVRDYAERLVRSLGYNDAICTAMEFQMFNVAEELRFMQDDYKGYE